MLMFCYCKISITLEAEYLMFCYIAKQRSCVENCSLNAYKNMIVIDNNLIVSFVEYYEIIDIIMGRDFAPGALFV
jgi:hypothetical protein